MMKLYFAPMAIIVDQFVWMLPPKTATTSIKAAIAAWKNIEADALPIVRADFGAQLHDRPRYVVHRNPWERLVSCYLSKVAGQKHPWIGFEKHGIRGGMPFQQFVKCVDTSWHNPNEHWAPCSYWADLADHEIEFAELSTTWPELQIQYGLPALPHHYRQTNAGETWRSYYDQGLWNRVARLYSADIDRWYSNCTF